MPNRAVDITTYPATGGFLGALGRLSADVGMDEQANFDELDKLQAEYDAVNAPPATSGPSGDSGSIELKRSDFELPPGTFGNDYSYDMGKAPDFGDQVVYEAPRYGADPGADLDQLLADTAHNQQPAYPAGYKSAPGAGPDYGAGITTPYAQEQKGGTLPNSPLISTVNSNASSTPLPPIITKKPTSFFADNKNYLIGGGLLAAAILYWKLRA